jgi:hypothetical protein
MRAHLLRSAEQLVNIAFPISDMDAALRLIEE